MISVREHYKDFPYPNSDPIIATTTGVPLYYHTTLGVKNPRLQDVLIENKHNYIPDDTKTKQHILVVGCGTQEANVIAMQNTNFKVIGVDFSKESTKIARQVAKNYGIKNVSILTKNFFDNDDFRLTDHEQYDTVVASGVLHHTDTPHAMLEKIKRLLKYGGALQGMVYLDTDRRQKIRTISERFRKRNFTPQDVRDFFEKNKNYLDTSLVSWYDVHTKIDEEIADTWLHPYWTTFSQESLKDALKRTNFDVKTLETQVNNISDNMWFKVEKPLWDRF